MKKIFLLLILLMMSLSSSDIAVKADSLWQTYSTSTYTAVRREFNLHDLISIIVNEKTTASTSADTNTDKRTRMEMDLAKWLKFSTANGGLNMGSQGSGFHPEIDLDSRLRLDNSGETNRQGNIYFTITGEVVEILPNGNLIIEAKSNRVINSEKETLTVTGTVRPEDVSISNTVTSSKISALEVYYDGDGVVSDSNDRGFFGWLASVLWPF